MSCEKVVVVTGAGGTLCSELSVSLAVRGYRVVLLGRTESKLEKVRKRIEQENGEALIALADVTHADELERSREMVLGRWGRIDALINGAGGKIAAAVTEKTAFTPEELDGKCYGFFNLNTSALREEMDLNIMGTFLPTQLFGAAMARHGGSIINFASMNSYRPLSRMPGYALSKAAIVNLTQWLACYLAPAGIRVNAIAPGFFVNERSRKLLYREDGSLSSRGEQVMVHTPMGRFGEARELTGTVCWLLDNELSSFVNGVCIPVDGGFLSSSGL